MSKNSRSNGLMGNIFRVLSANFWVAMVGFVSSFVFPKILTIDDYALYHTFTLYLTYITILHLGFPSGMVINYAGKDYEKIDKNQYKTEVKIIGIILGSFTLLFFVLSLVLKNRMLAYIALAIIPYDLIGSYKALLQAWSRFKEFRDEKFKSQILDSEFKEKISGILSELNKENGYLKMKVGDEYKYYNFKFEEKDIKDVLSSNNLFVSKKDGKYGFIDKDGNVVVDYIYDEAQEQNKYGFAAVKKDNLWGAIDREGKETVTPKYKMKNYLIIDFIGKWHLGQDVNMNYYCEK